MNLTRFNKSSSNTTLLLCMIMRVFWKDAIYLIAKVKMMIFPGAAAVIQPWVEQQGRGRMNFLSRLELLHPFSPALRMVLLVLETWLSWDIWCRSSSLVFRLVWTMWTDFLGTSWNTADFRTTPTLWSSLPIQPDDSSYMKSASKEQFNLCILRT